MKNSTRNAAALCLVVSSAIFAWIAWDAGNVQSALGLTALASEAAVAVVGLAVAGAGSAGAILLWRRGRQHAGLHPTS